ELDKVMRNFRDQKKEVADKRNFLVSAKKKLLTKLEGANRFGDEDSAKEAERYREELESPVYSEEES
ncbi:MAG: hypothetical protein VXB01_02585, partial [Opitutae bacterium]